MSESNTTDERGALVLAPQLPQVPQSPPRGRFTLLISDSFCFEVSETKDVFEAHAPLPRSASQRQRISTFRLNLSLGSFCFACIGLTPWRDWRDLTLLTVTCHDGAGEH